MKKLKLIIFVVIVISAGIYFRAEIFNFIKDEKIADFEKNSIENLLNEIKKQVSAPPPLKVFKENGGNSLTINGIIKETNTRRAEYGLEPLSENRKLNQAALAKAQDILKNQYFDHISPDGIGPDKLVSNYSYQFILVGENLILGNFEGDGDAVNQWMDSPGHRENILNPKFLEIGVGVLSGQFEGRTVWVGVQEFGRPVSSCPVVDKNLKLQIEAYQQQAEELSYEILTLRKELESIKKNSVEYAELAGEYNRLVDQYDIVAVKVKALVEDYNMQVRAFNNCIQQ